MASPKTKFAVGLFMAGGISFAVLVIIWLGMSRFLSKGQYYVSYFDESVQGLDVDSPVKYRGVFIGRVAGIGVAPDAKLIRVLLKIESGQTLDRDIVAQLKSVGITGSMFIELDRRKKGEPDLSPPLSFPSQYPIVASKPSEIGELLSGINEVLNQLKLLDINTISEKIIYTLDHLNQKASDANVKGISDQIEKALARVDHILDDRRWNKIIASVEEVTQSANSLLHKAGNSLDRMDQTIMRMERIVTGNEATIKAAIDDFRLAMNNANILLERGSSLVRQTDDSISHLSQHLLAVANNLEKASEDLTQIMELLMDQPSQLIFGQPPVPRDVEADVYNR